VTAGVDVTPIPVLPPGDTWTWQELSRSRTRVALAARRGDAEINVVLERCAAGRLRDAYPVHAHDGEIILAAGDVNAGAHLVRELFAAVCAADPGCRRVVLTVPAGDAPSIASGRAAGFEHIVDVDLPGVQLSVLLAEPDWVGDVAMALEMHW